MDCYIILIVRHVNTMLDRDSQRDFLGSCIYQWILYGIHHSLYMYSFDVGDALIPI
jgi:hypothetical protein